MQLSFDWYLLIAFITAALGFIVAIIHLFSNKSESFSARLLATFLCFFSATLIGNLLSETRFYFQHPHFWRLAVFFSLCFPALAYLYTRSMLLQQIRFRRSDWLFFVPAVLFTLSYVPFYLSSEAYKLEILQREVTEKSLAAMEPEGMLPPGWGIALRLLFGFTLAVAQCILLVRHRNSIKLLPKLPHNALLFKWLVFFTITISATFFVLIVEYLFKVYAFQRQLITLTIVANILLTCFYLLLRPEILYGFTGWKYRGVAPVAHTKVDADLWETTNVEMVGIPENDPVLPGRKHFLAEENEASGNQTISIQQATIFKEAVEQLFLTKKPFLQPDYSLDLLVNDAGIPRHTLSAFINQQYGMGFREFINRYRVDYFKENLGNPGWSNLTLEAISEECGFNSRTTFIKNFKAITGQTPSEYVKANG